MFILTMKLNWYLFFKKKTKPNKSLKSNLKNHKITRRINKNQEQTISSTSFRHGRLSGHGRFGWPWSILLENSFYKFRLFLGLCFVHLVYKTCPPHILSQSSLFVKDLTQHLCLFHLFVDVLCH
jgi:hypothetical protein